MYCFTDIFLTGGVLLKKAFLSFLPTRKQWTRMEDLPSERTYHGSIIVNDSMYLVGGVGNKDIDKYDAETKNFVTLNSMDKARSGFGICLYNEDSIIVAGGKMDDGSLTKTSFLYNTRYNNFKKLGVLNENKYGLVLVNCLGTIFAIGGSHGERKQIEKFNPRENTWERLAVNLKDGRFQPRAVAHDEFIYVFGGHNRLGGMENSVEKYDTKTNQLTTIGSRLLLARNCFSICEISSEIYVIGGDTQDYSVTNETKTLNYYFTRNVEVFNLKNEKFSLGKNLSVADEGMAAVSMKNVNNRFDIP